MSVFNQQGIIDMNLYYKCDRMNVARALSAPVIFLFPYYYGFPEGYAVITALLL